MDIPSWRRRSTSRPASCPSALPPPLASAPPLGRGPWTRLLGCESETAGRSSRARPSVGRQTTSL
eukprot:1037808-Pleurochrysis_carterae.AAC.1